MNSESSAWDVWFVLATSVVLAIATVVFYWQASAPWSTGVTFALSVGYFLAFLAGNAKLNGMLALPLKVVWGLGEILAAILGFGH